MTNNELNNYVKNYIENDKTHSAIMLAAPWGAGKSYYIQNSLKPFLEKSENGKHQCIVVSLYGLNETVEISKSIYLELRIGYVKNWWNRNILSRFSKKMQNITREVIGAGKSFGSTVIKGLTEKFVMEFNISDKKLNQLYNSIDLTGKLIVLEDLERSKMNILDVLGYVNSLVEQDGVKVLLVANEKHFIKYEIDGKLVEDYENVEEDLAIESLVKAIGNPKEEPQKTLSNDSIKYLKEKEKTISDTLIYSGNQKSAITAILCDFIKLSSFNTAIGIEEIVYLLSTKKCHNLRSFIFACQKTNEILEKLRITPDEEFKKCIFYSVILFSIKLRSGQREGDYRICWDSNTKFSSFLGSPKYPLPYFCYNYVENHTIDENDVIESAERYKKMLVYDPDTDYSDPDLSIIFSYYYQQEADVLKSIENILEKLQNNRLPLYLYGKLARYFVELKVIVELDFDYEKGKTYLIKNIKGKNEELQDEMFHLYMESNDTKTEQVFQKLKQDMINSLNDRTDNYFNFDYNPESISNFHNDVISKQGAILTEGAFARYLDVEKIYKMLKRCSAKQIYDFRLTFSSVYKSVNIGEYLSRDKKTIKELLEKSKNLLSHNEFDKIQEMQLKYFIGNLEEIMSKL